MRADGLRPGLGGGDAAVGFKDETQAIPGKEGPAVTVALKNVAPEAAQHGDLCVILYKLGHAGHTPRPAQAGDGSDDVLANGVRHHFPADGPVDFHRADRELLEVLEGTVPHAEIVDGEEQPGFVEVGQDAAFRGIGAERGGFRHFKADEGRRQAVRVQAFQQLLRETAPQLERGNVDGHGQVFNSPVEPVPAHGAGRVEDPQADGPDEPGILRQRDGDRRGNRTVGNVIPAEKRLHTLHPARGRGNLRLELQIEPPTMLIVVFQIDEQAARQRPHVAIVIKDMSGRPRGSAGKLKETPERAPDLLHPDLVGQQHERHVDEHPYADINNLEERAAQGPRGQVAVEQDGRRPLRFHAGAGDEPGHYGHVADGGQQQRRDQKGDKHERVEHDGQAEEQHFVDVEDARHQRDEPDAAAGLRLAPEGERQRKADARPGPAHEHESIHERLGHDVGQRHPCCGCGFVGEYGRAVDVVRDRIEDVGAVHARKPQPVQRKDVHHPPPEPFPDGVEGPAQEPVYGLVQRHPGFGKHERPTRGKDHDGQHPRHKRVEGLRDGDVRRAAGQVQVQFPKGKEKEEKPRGKDAHEDGHEKPGHPEPAQGQRAVFRLEQTEKRGEGHQPRDDRIGPQDGLRAVELERQVVSKGKDHDERHHGKGAVFQDIAQKRPVRAEMGRHERLIARQGETVQKLGQRPEEHERQGDHKGRTDRRQRRAAGNVVRPRQEDFFNLSGNVAQLPYHHVPFMVAVPDPPPRKASIQGNGFATHKRRSFSCTGPSLPPIRRLKEPSAPSPACPLLAC